MALNYYIMVVLTTTYNKFAANLLMVEEQHSKTVLNEQPTLYKMWKQNNFWNKINTKQSQQYPQNHTS